MESVVSELGAWLSVQIEFVLVLDVLFEVVARNCMVGVEENGNEIAGSGTTSKKLGVVFVECGMNLIDVPVDHRCIGC